MGTGADDNVMAASLMMEKFVLDWLCRMHGLLQNVSGNVSMRVSAVTLLMRGQQLLPAGYSAVTAVVSTVLRAARVCDGSSSCLSLLHVHAATIMFCLVWSLAFGSGTDCTGIPLLFANACLPM